MQNENQNFPLANKKDGKEMALSYHNQLILAEAELRKKLYGSSKKNGLHQALSFGITTAIIFAFSFSVMNFSAYQKQASFWIANLRADILGENIVLENLEAQINAKAIVKKTELPPLPTEISPADNRIVITKFNVFAPIQEIKNLDLSQNDWGKIETQIQDALKNGVVHFPGSAKPGTRGNAFFTGHSSYYPWSDGKYKDIFALLHQIKIGDIVTVWSEQKRYDYQVNEIKEVRPNQTEVLAQTDDRRLTLMTCTPIGTTLRRLIVTAHLVSES